MQPAKRMRSIRWGGTTWLVLAAVALAGCSALPVSLQASGPLVTVQTRGGLCANDALCDRTITLERDGRVHSAAKPPNDLGRVPADRLAALDAAIRSADYAKLRSRPFSGECPVNFDGQELIVEFGAPGGTQRLASCEVDVDWGSPLFVALGAALAQWVPLPLT